MTILEVRGGRRLTGAVTVPPDKSITHRALILSALGTGRCVIEPLSKGADNHATIDALRALGVRIDVEDDRAIVHGVGGPEGLIASETPIDCQNSGTTMRLLAGVLAHVKSPVTLTGDASLSRRPMSRLQVLEKTGVTIAGEERDGKIYPPITVQGPADGVSGAEHRLAIASAQVKTATLLAGLFANAPTSVSEPSRSRDHTERMLRALGAELTYDDDGTINLKPLSAPWSVERIEVAPDLSSAAFMLAASLVTDGSVVVETAVNPTRAGFLDALQAFGAAVHKEPQEDRGGEPTARVSVYAERLVGTVIEGTRALRAIDEIPLLAGLAAFASGTTEIRDAAELRLKESDRLAASATLLRAFGAHVEERPDGLVIEGNPGGLKAASVDAMHDHRIGMTAAVMGLGVEGCTEIRGAEIIDVSYPGFGDVLSELGAQVSEQVGRKVSG